MLQHLLDQTIPEKRFSHSPEETRKLIYEIRSRYEREGGEQAKDLLRRSDVMQQWLDDKAQAWRDSKLKWTGIRAWLAIAIAVPAFLLASLALLRQCGPPVSGIPPHPAAEELKQSPTSPPP